MASVALTMLLPVLFTFSWAAMSAAMYHFGSTSAQAAAQTAASAAAVEGGTTGACEQAAARFLATLGDAISDVTITCNRSATTATATVTGATLSLVPGWAPTVTQTVAVAVERIS
jgi:hypothetical protein